MTTNKRHQDSIFNNSIEEDLVVILLEKHFALSIFPDLTSLIKIPPPY